jgi:hypothetical protein
MAKLIKCPHYRGSGYGYRFKVGKAEIEFCMCQDCQMNLLGQMLQQIVIEHYCWKNMNS